VARKAAKSGVLFTGEYLIGNGSNAARLLPVEMTEPTNLERLRLLTKGKPLLLSTFYFYFIKWYIGNYHVILDFLKTWHATYSGLDMGVHLRLQETHFYLNTAYALFLQYLFDKSFISEEDVKKVS